MFEIISKKEAISKGLDRFFTGKLCKRNHQSHRYVKGGGCVACLSKEITVRSPTSLDLDPRIEMINRRLAIQESEVENERIRLALKAQSLALKSQVTEAQKERKAAREKRKFLKEHLVTVKIMGFGADYHVAVNMVWMAALMRNPEITKEDVLTGRKDEFGHHIMRCFPEDQIMLCEQTHALYLQRHTRANPDALRQQALASAQASEQAEIDREWPELKP